MIAVRAFPNVFTHSWPPPPHFLVITSLSFYGSIVSVHQPFQIYTQLDLFCLCKDFSSVPAAQCSWIAIDGHWNEARLVSKIMLANIEGTSKYISTQDPSLNGIHMQLLPQHKISAFLKSQKWTVKLLQSYKRIQKIIQLEVENVLEVDSLNIKLLRLIANPLVHTCSSVQVVHIFTQNWKKMLAQSHVAIGIRWWKNGHKLRYPPVRAKSSLHYVAYFLFLPHRHYMTTRIKTQMTHSKFLSVLSNYFTSRITFLKLSHSRQIIYLESLLQ